MTVRVGETVSTSHRPSREDGLVRSLSGWLGGVVGAHAGPGRSRWHPLVPLWLVTTAVFALGLLQKAPCHAAGWLREGDFIFTRLCYSDIALLYRERGFAAGDIAYLDSGGYPPLEYPVLTGAFMQLTSAISGLFGSGDEVRDSVLFFDVTTVLLFGCALLAVWATYRAVRNRPYDAMMVAAAPSLALTGLINWDLFAVALATCALLAWSRDRVFLAGVLLGLAVAAKFYPLLFLGPMFVLALRSRRLRHWIAVVLTAGSTWVVVNAPVIILAPGGWQAFWTFNQQRGAEFGSLWYVLENAGIGVGSVNAWSTALFALACVGIAVVGLNAPRRPRLAQLVFLTVAAFLIFNKVYSPQYVLWLLPLVAMARPRWRDWAIWQAGEAIYWLAIWLHLAGHLAPASGGSDGFYAAAVAIRIGVTCYLMGQVLRDIYRPATDIVRRDGADDPGGGPFDQAPDGRWLGRGAREAR